MGDTDFLDEDLTPEDIRQAYGWIRGKPPPPNVDVQQLMHQHRSRRQFQRWLVSSKAALHQNLINRFGAEKWVAAEILDGKRIWLNLCDRHMSMGCLVDEWEPLETAFMCSVLKPGHCVVDAGANLGWFSLVAAGCVGRTGTVYAFEPQARIFRFLRRTIDENYLADRIHAYECALSDRWERLGMAWDPSGANMGRAWLTRTPDRHAALDSVGTAPFDEVVPNAIVDFMKIDTEGAEMLVLAGAVNTIKRCQPILMVEVFPQFLRAVSGCDHAELFRFVADLGYVVFTLADDQGRGWRLAPMTQTWTEGYRTAIFLPADRAEAVAT